MYGKLYGMYNPQTWRVTSNTGGTWHIIAATNQDACQAGVVKENQWKRQSKQEENTTHKDIVAIPLGPAYKYNNKGEVIGYVNYGKRIDREWG